MTEHEAFATHDYHIKLSLGGTEEVDIYFDLMSDDDDWHVDYLEVFHKGHRLTDVLDFDFVAESLYENASTIEKLIKEKNADQN